MKQYAKVVVGVMVTVALMLAGQAALADKKGAMDAPHGASMNKAEKAPKKMDVMEKDEETMDNGDMGDKKNSMAMDKKDEMVKDGEAMTGLAKQKEKKMEMERKEEGKGSEMGQEKREEHRRKWWRFWE